MNPIDLKNSALKNAYQYFDKNIRPLPKNADGTINEEAGGFVDNDVDAFRHAYVSGVFTQEYGEKTADFFGRLNEELPFGWYSKAKNPDSYNMDLWNNSVGRKYGNRINDKIILLKAIHDALIKGELITAPKDPRRYEGETSSTYNKSKPVTVLKEDENNRNILFYDMIRQTVLSREAFVAGINSGAYPSYTVKNIKGVPTPVSKPDSRDSNNLG